MWWVGEKGLSFKITVIWSILQQNFSLFPIQNWPIHVLSQFLLFFSYLRLPLYYADDWLFLEVTKAIKWISSLLFRYFEMTSQPFSHGGPALNQDLTVTQFASPKSGHLTLILTDRI